MCLSGLDIVENGISIIRDHFGRNSGEAFVQFSSHEAADEALQRDREFMGSRSDVDTQITFLHLYVMFGQTDGSVMSKLVLHLAVRSS